VKVVDNPKRNIPSGLNRAIEASEGKYLIRLDAHSVPAPDYVERCVRALEDGMGDNVGGIWDIKPSSDGWVSKSISLAASHPLGVGDAYYRVGGKSQEVDTVPFGAFRRSLVDKIGSFDESLLSNEDYEFNARIRKAGGKVWLDPQIRSTYFARSTFHDLAKQYWRYGYWKIRMLVRYPETFRWRQLAGGFMLTWLILGLLSIWFPLARWLILLEAVVYCTVLFGSGTNLAIKRRSFMLLIGVPLAIATMHFSWGSAFLWSAGELILAKLAIRRRPGTK
ncbi:glycosyl transferase, partial [bacterium SM23_57]